MKAIIKSVFLSVALAHATYAMCGTAISVYAGAYGDAILIDSGENKTLLVAGGAIPQGPATPSDCFAKATLHLKKRPNFYEGPLNPVRNEIIDVDANSVSGKRAGVYIYPSRIRIGNVEVNGICADGIDFSGDYKKVAEQSAKYASTFTYFMRMEGQNAADMRKHGKPTEANEALRPFIEANHTKLKLDKEDRKTVESISKEYEFTQKK
ncbi:MULTISPECIES: hypothetical protein [Paraburkholderia]|uniref:hypothetical protein n=1 Tax=Paraburkholderia TaxID=1822464 RepID=UPI0013A6C346|nr:MULTISPECIES: hypothetical protein [Paraburkholderia]MDH6146697.1 hypothetical protein [Paraburkholderia sp. WSM4179]